MRRGKEGASYDLLFHRNRQFPVRGAEAGGRGEQIVSIVDALRSKAFHYTLSEGEKLGFVFPVYFYRCPVSAIQYGKKTASRGRYVNPVLK